MKIKDRPEFKNKVTVLTMGPDDVVSSAVALMSEKNYGAVVVVDGQDMPIGIVTERDFMRRLLNAGLDPRTTRLGDIMTSDLKVAKADDDLLSWLQQMSNERFRHLPVVGEDGKLIRMMSQGDFVAYTWPQLLGRVTEQARATFDISPSLFMMVGGGIVFMLAVIAIFTAVN